MANKSSRRLFLVLSIAVIMMLVHTSNEHLHDDNHGHSHHGHGHSHGHVHNEPDEHPSFKYSRAANEKQQEHHDHSHGDPKDASADVLTHPPPAAAKTRGGKVRDRFTIALHALVSTFVISVAPFFILFFIPLNDNNGENQALLKVLLGFASGSLLGDAFLHLIPHALDSHDHSAHSHSHSHLHDHDHHDHSQQTNVGLWVMSGILTFLMVEKLIVNLNGGEHTHLNSSHQTEKEKVGAAKKDDDKSKKKEAEKKKEEHKQGIKVAGYLNLAADFAHNFTDGLAIGASFLAGQNLGIITTFTILFHEVPHEIGDFAILIQSGCSKKKAIFLQLVTAIGALSGTLLSLLFESAMSGFATACILPFTAGGFIYIATVTIIPELKESSGLVQSVKEILALMAGVVMMVVISYIE